MESSSIFVCSAMNLTQKQDLCTSCGHTEWEKAGFFSIGLLISSSLPLMAMPARPGGERSSESDWIGPWIWQLPPKSGPSARLERDSFSAEAADGEEEDATVPSVKKDGAIHRGY